LVARHHLKSWFYEAAGSAKRTLPSSSETTGSWSQAKAAIRGVGGPIERNKWAEMVMVWPLVGGGEQAYQVVSSQGSGFFFLQVLLY